MSNQLNRSKENVYLADVENISYDCAAHSWTCNMSTLYRESKTCEDQEEDIDDFIINYYYLINI